MWIWDEDFMVPDEGYMELLPIKASAVENTFPARNTPVQPSPLPRIRKIGSMKGVLEDRKPYLFCRLSL